MANFLTSFLTGFASSAALIIAIGAQNLFVLRQGLRREHVLPIVLFCGCADAILIIAGVGGVGAFVGAAPRFTMLLTLGGCVFLTWHGVTALRRLSVVSKVEIGAGNGLTLRRAIASTAGFTFLNPHVYLDTVLLLGAIGSAQPAALRPAFTAGAISASVSWFTALGFGARILKPVFSRPAAWRALDAIVGLTMLALAGSLLLRVTYQGG
ncbi:LysE/ArgO family amino acid transporter [Acidocella aminolytica]|uniref:Lysine exporter protein LysE/YggA n=1 Tax=Acidocella aminolytica 101 = DSM 11237 TaxID=1120923 RepID=A0A0D6PF53_9PROT|nr:LysE/ArgO family amino acid transporter [Acidocella aminolytica]GAN79489.1 lysine exporter protein LysE/YggA [Acidocella aminolytica 101 = DSM 11237]GBQ33544.1 lysine efflux permease [Acidocella aminolytica 101 = DSM 11237]SHE47123.1 L-lysine exporter family protein LysE/ArgO [Acidocella aminolytica 101 = DSM 11237]